MGTALDVRKTYKLFIGGNFVRSESGRYLPAQSAAGNHLDNICHASRKDLRDAVAAGYEAVMTSVRGRTAPGNHVLNRNVLMDGDNVQMLAEAVNGVH